MIVCGHAYQGLGDSSKAEGSAGQREIQCRGQYIDRRHCKRRYSARYRARIYTVQGTAVQGKERYNAGAVDR